MLPCVQASPIKLAGSPVYVIPGDDHPITGYFADEVIRRAQPPESIDNQLLAYLRTVFVFIKRDASTPSQMVKRAEGWFNRFHDDLSSVDRERIITSVITAALEGSPADMRVREWMRKRGALGVQGMNLSLTGAIIPDRGRFHQAVAGLLNLDGQKWYDNWQLKRRVARAQTVLPPVK